MSAGPPDESNPQADAKRLRLSVRGTVQGVGFRPYVYGLAGELGLRGFVTNTSEGVTIEVEGEKAGEFRQRLAEDAPPLASVDAVEVEELSPRGDGEFRILQSEGGDSFTLVSPDVSVCEDCLKELFDTSDRRYRYPFINCTNCGPRYTITLRTPYDRPNTTMAGFTMCRACRDEYVDPSDRRFHAQPNACPDCGPRLALSDMSGSKEAEGDAALEAARQMLKEGGVLAVKGLGGFHLACDAANPDAVAKLRARKRKNRKPFAVMVPDVKAAREFCEVSEAEERLLASSRRPIVLLPKSGKELPEEIAPGNSRLGVMLPYTPLHYLLIEGFRALVMTSANISEEPIQIDGQSVREKLSHLADRVLDHDRGIFMRADDSVLKLSGSARFVRRARGYTPEPVRLSSDGPDVLGVGAEVKNTFTIMRGPYAVVSQHIGDMENYETLRFFEETLENLKAVYRANPVALAYDLHPRYLSTHWALKQQDFPKLGVQHHHAHVASVMAEHGLQGPVMGIALDGIGYGPDGTLWGGEFLVCDAAEMRRVGHFMAVPLPGGERAVREPWRMAVSYVLEAVGKAEAAEYLRKSGLLDRMGGDKIDEVIKVAELKEFSPLSSGAGRLFDAASSLLGVCDENSFEGEAAIALEAACADRVTGEYPVEIKFRNPAVLDFSYALIGIIDDIESGVPKREIAARFHNTVVGAVVRTAERLSRTEGLSTVALSGGVAQNDYLLARLENALRALGLAVYSNEVVPLNDGGISLGQAHILREHIKRGMVTV